MTAIEGIGSLRRMRHRTVSQRVGRFSLRFLCVVCWKLFYQTYRQWTKWFNGFKFVTLPWKVYDIPRTGISFSLLWVAVFNIAHMWLKLLAFQESIVLVLREGDKYPVGPVQSPFNWVNPRLVETQRRAHFLDLFLVFAHLIGVLVFNDSEQKQQE